MQLQCHPTANSPWLPPQHSTTTPPASHCLQGEMRVLTDNHDGRPCRYQQQWPPTMLLTLANLTTAMANNSDNDMPLLPHHCQSMSMPMTWHQCHITNTPPHLSSPPHDEAEQHRWQMTTVGSDGDNSNGRQQWVQWGWVVAMVNNTAWQQWAMFFSFLFLC